MGNGKHEAWQALKFTLFSASAGIIQIVTYTLMYEVLHWAPWLSYLVSLILSVLWNFTFNRKYTFRSDADIKRSMLLVGLFYLVFTPLSTWWTAALTGENPFTGAAASGEPLVNNYRNLWCTGARSIRTSGPGSSRIRKHERIPGNTGRARA